MKRKRLMAGLFSVGMLLSVCICNVMAEEQTEKQTETQEEIQTEILQEDNAEEKIPVYFFHNTACGTCDGTEEFLQVAEEQISYYKEAYPYELKMFNVFKTSGSDVWEEISETYQLENKDYVFPVLVIDGEMYRSMEEIREHLHDAFLDAAGVSAVYFYREDCQECIDMAPFWESLPETYVVAETEYVTEIAELESRTGNNGDQIHRMFKEYEVPDDDQMVPFVFLREEYLAGHEDIEEKLMELLESGHGFTNTENK